MSGLIRKAAIALLPMIAICAGCTTEIDKDAFRAGAIKIQIDEVTSDELYPTAGDEIDWKMIFLPSPGDIIVNTFWDSPLEIFNVEVGVYDRFGIPILTQRRDTGGATGELRTFLPESGLHYIKLKAESGQSIYSINVRFESNYDGFVAPTSAPTFESYEIDEDSINDNAAKSANARNMAQNSSRKSGGSSSNSNDDDNSSASSDNGGSDSGSTDEGIELPTAAAGGAVLPTAAAGGIASSNGQSGPTVVRTSSGGSGYSKSEVRSMSQKTSAVATEKSAITPICSDIKGRHKKIEAEILSVSGKKKGAQIKLGVGHKDGVHEGSVGDIYVDGKILEGGRFKVEKIFETNCIAVTNASAADVKKANRFVVKSPD